MVPEKILISERKNMQHHPTPAQFWPLAGQLDRAFFLRKKFLW